MSDVLLSFFPVSLPPEDMTSEWRRLNSPEVALLSVYPTYTTTNDPHSSTTSFCRYALLYFAYSHRSTSAPLQPSDRNGSLNSVDLLFRTSPEPHC